MYSRVVNRIKIKATVRTKGTRTGGWFAEKRANYFRKKSRTQNLWNLHLAGACDYQSFAFDLQGIDYETTGESRKMDFRTDHVNV